jgi:hypothetical protein
MQPPQRPAADTPVGVSGANPGYALGQLARALATSETHESPEVRERAARKVEAWVQIFRGMLSGALQVGSRVPVAGAPAWATLAVMKGGFATGALLAGGELEPHERELLGRLPAVPAGAERPALNAHYLGDDGLDELNRLLASGCYRVHLPEEGALLVVAWLVRNGQADRARDLLDEIGPHFARLRFYPVPDPRPLTASSAAHLQDVGATVENLRAVPPSPRFERQKEAVEVWAPLYARVVELFAETVRGPVPTLSLGADGKPLRSEAGKFSVEGGWPCQQYPDGWQARARAALDDYRRLRAEHQLCASPESATAGFPTLRRYLERCATAPEQLTGRDVGMIRSILAGFATKRGLPGSERWRALRERQARQVAGPTTAELARVLVARLSELPQHEGVASLDEVLAPVSGEEAGRFGVPAGHSIPEGLAVNLRRCLDAPVGALVEQGVIRSAEVLARVVSQVTSQVRAAGVADAELRRLYGAVYAAFRRRRSLLLLNLQSQVKLEELPWVRAINAFRDEGVSARQQARQVLEKLVALAVTAFPQQILPNKLLQEVRALADGAGMGLPIVDEVAADIFMGEFSEKFLRAARKAAELLEGTIYERYYDLPFARVRRIDDVKPSRLGTATSPAFAQLCAELAGEGGEARGRSVVRNGKTIEQEQLLTTHNLAVLFDALGLAHTLGPRLEDMALHCYLWVCWRLREKVDAWQPRLRAVKNAAYAWRQMIFFLAVAPAGTVESFLSSAGGWLRAEKPDFQARFRPALEGLTRAARGLPAEATPTEDNPAGARRFLGWTTEKHWLLA